LSERPDARTRGPTRPDAARRDNPRPDARAKTDRSTSPQPDVRKPRTAGADEAATQPPARPRDRSPGLETWRARRAGMRSREDCASRDAGRPVAQTPGPPRTRRRGVTCPGCGRPCGRSSPSPSR
jgi:hypothetical protein